MHSNTENLTPHRRAAVFALAFSTLTTCGLAIAAAGAQSVNTSGINSAMQAATLTSINQVEHTEQGVETWLLVQGSGQCNFSIGSTAVAPQKFSSSFEKPFPMKIKIVGAPIGKHLWIAKGTGNCTGTAIATFSVNG